MLRDEAEKGLRERLDFKAKEEGLTPGKDEEWEKEYWERLDFELGIINQMGFPGYFLIVADFIQWAKDHDIPVGPGRGSGAGSVVAGVLKITDLDPLRFSLLFERFLNPERVSMPDFDIDFCQDKREQVIRYVQDKYGYDRVAQIITFGKLQARAVVKACGRVMQQHHGATDRLSKMIPNDPGNAMSLKEAIESEPRLQREIDTDELTARVMERALKLEGFYAHSSTHAAGVVIGDRPLDELVALYRDPKSDMPVTQFNMKWVEQCGLVKFDFLGLKTLTVLDRAVKYVRDRGIEIDLAEVPLDDRASYELLAAGESAGVFQLESTGMRSVLKGLKPDTFEDIIAIVALYRPGPMENIPTYVDRKHGREEVEYPHPILESILGETFGVIIYQEQVMQIAQVMSGYSLGEADLLRRAMGKKIKEEMDKQRGRFCDGAVERGITAEKASYIFDLVTKFASYGFNK
jgi:DNA polymerase-3 subunit alpha